MAVKTLTIQQNLKNFDLFMWLLLTKKKTTNNEFWFVYVTLADQNQQNDVDAVAELVGIH